MADSALGSTLTGELASANVSSADVAGQFESSQHATHLEARISALEDRLAASTPRPEVRAKAKRSSSIPVRSRASAISSSARRTRDLEAQPSKLARTSNSPMPAAGLRPKCTTPLPASPPHDPASQPSSRGRPRRSLSARASRPLFAAAGSATDTPSDVGRLGLPGDPSLAYVPLFDPPIGTPPPTTMTAALAGAEDSQRMRTERHWLRHQYAAQLEGVRRSLEARAAERLEALRREQQADYRNWKHELLQDWKRLKQEATERDEQRQALHVQVQRLLAEVQGLQGDRLTLSAELKAEIQLTSKLREQVGEAYTQLRVAEARIRQAEHRAERKEADRRLVLADRNRLRAALVEAGQEIPRLKQQVLDLARKVDLRDAPRVTDLASSSVRDILTTAAPSLPTPHPYPDAHLPGPSGPSPPPERDQPAVPVNQPLASPLPASAEALEAAECSRCAKSQQRVADLEAELQRLQAALLEEQETHRRLTAAQGEVVEEQRRALQECEEQLARGRAAEQEGAELRLQVAELQQRLAEVDIDAAELRQANGELERRCQRETEAAQDSRRQAEQQVRAKQLADEHELAELRGANAALRRECERLRDEDAARVGSKAALAGDASAALEARLQAVREELEEARQEAEQAEERHGAAVAKLREELQEKQRALEEATGVGRQLRNQAEALRRELEAVAHARQGLEARVCELEAAAQAAQGQQTEEERLRREVAALQARGEHDAAALLKQEATIADLRRAQEEVEGRLRQAGDEAEGLRAAVAQEVERSRQLEQQARALEGELAAAQEATAALEEQVGERQGTTDDAVKEAEQLRGEVAALQTRGERDAAALLKQEATIADLRRAQEEMEGRLRQAGEELEGLRAALAQAQANAGAAVPADALQAELEAAQEARQALEDQVYELEARIEELTAEREPPEAGAGEGEAVQALRREAETLRAEREADAEALLSQEGAVVELREAKTRSEAEAERWRAAAQEARERADEAEGRCQSARQELEAAQEARQALEDQVYELEARIEELTAEREPPEAGAGEGEAVQALRREVETLRAEREADAEALRTQEGAVAELREANARSEAEAERWRAAEQEARERADEADRRWEAAQKDLAEVQALLAAAEERRGQEEEQAEEVQRLRAQLAPLEARAAGDATALREALASVGRLEVEVADGERQQQQLSQALREATDKLQASEDRNDSLVAQHAETMRRCAALEAQLEAADSPGEEVTRLRAEVEALRAAAQRDAEALQQQDTDLEALRRGREDVEREVRRLRVEADGHLAALEEARQRPADPQPGASPPPPLEAVANVVAEAAADWRRQWEAAAEEFSWAAGRGDGPAPAPAEGTAAAPTSYTGSPSPTHSKDQAHARDEASASAAALQRLEALVAERTAAQVRAMEDSEQSLLAQAEQLDAFQAQLVALQPLLAARPPAEGSLQVVREEALALERRLWDVTQELEVARRQCQTLEAAQLAAAEALPPPPPPAHEEELGRLRELQGRWEAEEAAWGAEREALRAELHGLRQQLAQQLEAQGAHLAALEGRLTEAHALGQEALQTALAAAQARREALEAEAQTAAQALHAKEEEWQAAQQAADLRITDLQASTVALQQQIKKMDATMEMAREAAERQRQRDSSRWEEEWTALEQRHAGWLRAADDGLHQRATAMEAALAEATAELRDSAATALTAQWDAEGVAQDRQRRLELAQAEILQLQAQLQKFRESAGLSAPTQLAGQQESAKPGTAAVQHLEGLVARLAEERVVQLAAQEVALEADLDRWARLEEQLRQPRAEARPLPGAACDECESLRQSLAAERTATDALRGSLAKERSEAEVLHGEGERLGAEVAALEAALREKETALAVLSVRPPHPTVPVADVEPLAAPTAQLAGDACPLQCLEAEVARLTAERVSLLVAAVEDLERTEAQGETAVRLARRLAALVEVQQWLEQEGAQKNEALARQQEEMDLCLQEIQELKKKGGGATPTTRGLLLQARKENSELKQQLFERDRQLETIRATAAEEGSPGAVAALQADLDKKQKRITELKQIIADQNRRLNERS